jgi:cysteine desulfurase
MKHYLDHHATTPLLPQVAKIMQPLWTEGFGNPASVEHQRGLAAADRVEAARQEIARAVGAEAREIVFTSGATEANNIAVLGASRFRAKHEGRHRVLVFETEHSCVLGAADALTMEGFDVLRLPVDIEGQADLSALEAALDTQTALVCLMTANNEVGAIQPIAEAAALAHAAGAWLHSDAAQAVGKIEVNVRAMDVDLLSLSGHKLYGPMGIGALFVRRRPRVRLAPLVHGGGQERGIRAGTLPMPLIVGLGHAVSLAEAARAETTARHHQLREGLFERLDRSGLRYTVNGPEDPVRRLPGNLSLSFPDIRRDTLFTAMAAHGIAVSSGSACSSHDVAPSHVLAAMGIDPTLAQQTLRLGLGRDTSEADLIALEQALLAARAKAA